MPCEIALYLYSDAALAWFTGCWQSSRKSMQCTGVSDSVSVQMNIVAEEFSMLHWWATWPHLPENVNCGCKCPSVNRWWIRKRKILSTFARNILLTMPMQPSQGSVVYLSPKFVLPNAHLRTFGSQADCNTCNLKDGSEVIERGQWGDHLTAIFQCGC